MTIKLIRPRPPRILVGAYAALPPRNLAKEALSTGERSSSSKHLAERRFYAELREIDEVGGLEIPFYGKGIEALYAEDLCPEWENVLTCLPGTMNQLAIDPAFGLASTDEAGRLRAVEFVTHALATALTLRAAHGPHSVRAIEIHSAPRQGPGGHPSSTEAFTQSLKELRTEHWQGIELLVEHCDRLIAGQAPAKGFLSLDDEMQALLASDSVQNSADCETIHATCTSAVNSSDAFDYEKLTSQAPRSSRTLPIAPTMTKIAINWARSAIEARDPDEPLRQIKKLISTGRLGLLVFSGCIENDPIYGNWADSHAPMGGTSLLTLERLRDCFAAAGDCPIGIKIQVLPQSASMDERLALTKKWISLLFATLSQSQ